MIKRDTLSYTFYLKKIKAKRASMIPISMRITINGKFCISATGFGYHENPVIQWSSIRVTQVSQISPASIKWDATILVCRRYLHTRHRLDKILGLIQLQRLLSPSWILFTGIFAIFSNWNKPKNHNFYCIFNGLRNYFNWLPGLICKRFGIPLYD